MCPKFMCILLYVKFIWCSNIPYIYGQYAGGTSALHICAFCYMLKLCDVVVLYTSLGDWREVHVPEVYVHSAIC